MSMLTVDERTEIMRRSAGELADEGDLLRQVADLVLSNDFEVNPGYFQTMPGGKELYEDMDFSAARLSRSPITLNLSQEGFMINIHEWFQDILNDYTDNLYIRIHQDDEITEMGIDIETYCDCSLKDVGLYRYADDDSFEILLVSVNINGGPVSTFEPKKEMPVWFVEAVKNNRIIKNAYNAAFERVCLSRCILGKGKFLDPSSWRCTMIRSAVCGLPLSLDQCGEVLGIEDKKMKEGKALIRFFCLPCKPTKTNGMKSRNYPEDNKDKWEEFKKYNKRDVEAEQEIFCRLSSFVITDKEQLLYSIDQNINDRGVRIDRKLAMNAYQIYSDYKTELAKTAAGITGLDNPNSVSQLKEWLKEATGKTVESLNKKSLPDILSSCEDERVKKILSIRTEMGKTSVEKYNAMLSCVCSDGRVHGLLQFYGATRTGRWAGRLVQVQNLPQNHMTDLEHARAIVRGGDCDSLSLEYDNPMQVLSELIRTAFIASKGKTFHVCDFSAIEARVIAWVAGEKWALDVFRTTGKIYEGAAARMYHCDPSEITKTDPRRQKGKIATLALGYQGGVGALEKMGGAKMGLSEDEMKDIVNTWREANPGIVRLWSHVERAAKHAIENKEQRGATFTIERGISFYMKSGCLMVLLPSGRSLCYPRAGLSTDGRITYEGQNQVSGKWETIETYGGKMTENIIQAIARDCLAEIMIRVEKEMGYPIVFHIHDEIIVDADKGQTLEAIQKAFSTPISWAEQLPIKGDGYSTFFYLKD